MILLWGLPGDNPLAAVHRALQRLDRPVVLLDQRAVLETEIELCVDGAVSGSIQVGPQAVDLSAITAAYLRPHDSRQLPQIERAGCGSPAYWHAIGVEDALWSWAELTPALIVNRPSAMASNTSKPYQTTLIQSCGFEVPETLVTTDPKSALEFWTRHGAVIYKSMSGVRSVVSRLTRQHLDHLDDLIWCPTQFQQYIAGTDYRVHVVGDTLFPCEVVSAADDYRYAGQQGASIEIHTVELPEECAVRCQQLTAALGLLVAGIDLRWTPDGKWYCFEVNPSPGFTYYQAATNHPIDEAIARLLATGLKLPPRCAEETQQASLCHP